MVHEEIKKVDSAILEAEVGDRDIKLGIIRDALDDALNEERFEFAVDRLIKPTRFVISKDGKRLGVIKFSEGSGETSNPVEFLSVDTNDREQPGIMFSDPAKLKIVIESFLNGLNQEFQRRIDEEPTLKKSVVSSAR
ncbi:MAG TPA: hypothetical protein VJH71_01080 [Candidatus Paceibacterota bacterium]